MPTATLPQGFELEKPTATHGLPDGFELETPHPSNSAALPDGFELEPPSPPTPAPSIYSRIKSAVFGQPAPEPAMPWTVPPPSAPPPPTIDDLRSRIQKGEQARKMQMAVAPPPMVGAPTIAQPAAPQVDQKSLQAHTYYNQQAAQAEAQGNHAEAGRLSGLAVEAKQRAYGNLPMSPSPTQLAKQDVAGQSDFSLGLQAVAHGALDIPAAIVRKAAGAVGYGESPEMKASREAVANEQLLAAPNITPIGETAGGFIAPEVLAAFKVANLPVLKPIWQAVGNKAGIPAARAAMLAGADAVTAAKIAGATSYLAQEGVKGAAAMGATGALDAAITSEGTPSERLQQVAHGMLHGAVTGLVGGPIFGFAGLASGGAKLLEGEARKIIEHEISAGRIKVQHDVPSNRWVEGPPIYEPPVDQPTPPTTQPNAPIDAEFTVQPPSPAPSTSSGQADLQASIIKAEQARKAAATVPPPPQPSPGEIAATEAQAKDRAKATEEMVKQEAEKKSPETVVADAKALKSLAGESATLTSAQVEAIHGTDRERAARAMTAAGLTFEQPQTVTSETPIKETQNGSEISKTGPVHSSDGPQPPKAEQEGAAAAVRQGGLPAAPGQTAPPGAGEAAGQPDVVRQAADQYGVQPEAEVKPVVATDRSKVREGIDRIIKHGKIEEFVRQSSEYLADSEADPRAINDRFFADVWPTLPPEQKARVSRRIENAVGMKIGDLIYATGEESVRDHKHLMELAMDSGGNEFGHQEPLIQGILATMDHANNLLPKAAAPSPKIEASPKQIEQKPDIQDSPPFTRTVEMIDGGATKAEIEGRIGAIEKSLEPEQVADLRKRLAEREAGASAGEPAKPGAAEGKQPWEMTRDEFHNAVVSGKQDFQTLGGNRRPVSKLAAILRNMRASGNTHNIDILEKEIVRHVNQEHGARVTMAYVEGKPVPAEVLRDYPDLKPAAQPAPKSKPLNMAGETRPERPHPKPTPAYESLHPKAQEKFEAAARADRVSPTTAAKVSAMLEPMGDEDPPSLREAMANPANAANLVRSLVRDGALTEADATRYTDPHTGAINDAGKLAVEQTLMARLIPDASVLGRMPGGVKQKLMASLSPLMRAIQEPTLKKALTDAVESYNDYKSSGLSTRDYFFDQQSMSPPPGFGDRSVAAIVGGLEHFGPRKFRAALEDALSRLGLGDSQMMFGGEAKSVGPEQAITEAFGTKPAEGGERLSVSRRDGGSSDLAGVPEGSPAKIRELAAKEWVEKGTESGFFKRWFGNSKTVDKNGKPLDLYSGHSNVEMYGEGFDPKKATAGAFYATESPKIASNYAQGKIGQKEYYENGDQYRFQLKNEKWGKKLGQIKLTPEQQGKAREFFKNEDNGSWDIERYWKENSAYDKDARRALARGGLKDLQSVWQFLEYMGKNIAYAKENNAEGTIPISERQQKNTFEELLDHLKIPWRSYDWRQPGVFKVHVRITNPIDASEPFPTDLLSALKEASKRDRNLSESELNSRHWTRDYPLKQWVKDIESGDEYWPTHIPSKAVPIIKRFGYDGIKELGMKGAATREERQVNWIAFDPEQVKSATGNHGTFSPDEPNMRLAVSREMDQEPADPFYSALTRAVEGFPNQTSKMTPDQFRGWLAKQPVKADEIKWTNLDDYLKGKEKVTAGEIADYLRQNEVKVQEVVKENSPTWGLSDLGSGQYSDSFNTKQEAEDARLKYAEKFSKDELKGPINYHDTDIWYVKDLESGDKHEFDSKKDAQTKYNDLLDDKINQWLEAIELVDPEHSETSDGETKFGQYQLPGGENYRELLLTLPSKAYSYRLPGGGLIPASKYESLSSHERSLVGEGVKEPITKDSFRSSHFPEPSILAHVRFNDRTTADGKKTLFIEEVQSDWAQQARKEGVTGPAPEPLSELPSDAKTIKRQEGGYFVQVPSYSDQYIGSGKTTEAARSDALQAMNFAREQKAKSGVPAAPFIGSTEAWSTLAMKRMVRWAAEHGYDSLSWTTGAQQVNRYPEALRQVVDNISWKPWDTSGLDPNSANVDVKATKAGSIVFSGTVRKADGYIMSAKPNNAVGKNLAEVIGKTMAARATTEPNGEISGKDFTVGGEGMKGFYDQILPSVANKIGKKWGARVGETQISTSELDSNWLVSGLTARQGRDIRHFNSEAEAMAFAEANPPREKTTVHSLPITDAMRESVVNEGQARFATQRAGGVQSPHEQATQSQAGVRAEIHDEQTGAGSRLGGQKPGERAGITRHGPSSIGALEYARRSDPGQVKSYYEAQGAVVRDTADGHRVEYPNGGPAFDVKYVDKLIPLDPEKESHLASIVVRAGGEANPDGTTVPQTVEQFQALSKPDRAQIVSHFKVDGSYNLDTKTITLVRGISKMGAVDEETYHAFAHHLSAKDYVTALRPFKGKGSWIEAEERGYQFMRGKISAPSDLTEEGIAIFHDIRMGEGRGGVAREGGGELASASTAGLPDDAPASAKERAAKEWQERGVESRFFRRFFGDSVVTDTGKAGGRPLVVYHGSDKDFNTFENRGGKVSVLFSTFDVERGGYFFSPVKKVSEEFGKNTRSFYLAIKNPADFRGGYSEVEQRMIAEKGYSEGFFNRDAWEYFDKQDDPKWSGPRGGLQFVNDLKALGYDGAIIQEPIPHSDFDKYGIENYPDTYVAFSSNQAKSSTSNTGEFSDSPDMRLSVSRNGGEPPKPPEEGGRPEGEGEPEKPKSEGIAKAAANVGGFNDALKRIFNPASRTPESQQTAGIVRERVAQMVRENEKAQEALKEFSKTLGKMSVDDQVGFIDRMENGERQPTGDMTRASIALRQRLDDGREAVIGLGTGKLENWIENYFPHIWEQPQKAGGIIARILGKRPLEGSKSFLKQRTIPTTKEGIEAGLVPVTYNPVDLALLKLREMNRYVMAHKVLAEMKDQGLVRFVKATRKAPDGYVKINDSIGTVYASPDREGTMRIRGSYYAPEAAATILNNYLSPGLRGNPIFDAYMGAGNLMNQASLGLSFFHGMFTTIDSATSQLSLAIEHGLNAPLNVAIGAVSGRPEQVRRGLSQAKAAPIDLLKTAISPIRTLVLGSKVLKEYLKPGSVWGDIAQIVDSLVAGGGRVKMDTFFKNNSVEKFLDALHKGRLVRAGLHSIPAMLETFSKPLMEWYVPRLKLGVFMDMARYELGKLGPSPDQNAVRKAMGDIWDTVDNRLGQMVYDNRFWNKTLKDLSHASIRSVGWNVGTFSLGSGAIKDAIRTPGKVLRGEDPVGRNLAYVMALPAMVAALGALMTYLYTGKGPEELKDYFYPRTGEKDEQGNPVRVQLPTYIKDAVALSRHPIDTVVHKAHPLLSTLVEMMQNKNFYGDMIRNPDDPAVKQLEQESKFMLDQFTPFSVKNYQQQQRSGGTKADAVSNFFGITPAPKFITRTPAENIMQEFVSRHIPQGATPEQADKRNLRYELLNMLKKGDPEASSRIDQAIQDGSLSKGEAKRLYATARVDPRVAKFKRLTVDEAIEVLKEANLQERTLWRRDFIIKVQNARKKGWKPQDPDLLNKLMRGG